MVEPYSIYTKRIAKKGELLTHDSDQAVLTLLKTSEVIESDFLTVRIDATLRDLVEKVSQSKRNIFPVVDSRNHFQGYVSLEDIRRDMFKYELYDTLHVYNFMKSAPAYVYVDEKMDSVMKKFEKTEAWNRQPSSWDIHLRSRKATSKLSPPRGKRAYGWFVKGPVLGSGSSCSD
jgi:CIC family chloride channel protein